MHIPISPRLAGLMLAATAAVGWYEAVTVNNTAPQQSSRPAARSVQRGRSTDTTIPSTERLRERMSSSSLPSKGRNPFVYGARMSSRPAASRDTGAVFAPPVEPAPPALPVFRLSGIASNVENGVAVLTAIMNDNGAMVFVKAGDKLSNGYSVVKVDEGSVTIVDADGVTQTIKLP